MPLRNINRLTLLGRLRLDPERRQTAGGTAVVQLSLVTSRKWTERGQPRDKTESHRVVLWDTPKLAALVAAATTARKNDVCYVEGRVEYRKYVREGRDVWVTEVIAHDVVVLGPCISAADERRIAAWAAERAAQPARPIADSDSGDDGR